MHKSTAHFLALIILFPAFAYGQARADASDALKPVLFDSIKKSCPSVSGELVNHTNAGPVLQTRPIDTDKVCTCAATAFVGDKHLLRGLAEGASLPASDPRKTHLDAYMYLRLMHSVMTCLAPEIGESLTRSAPGSARR